MLRLNGGCPREETFSRWPTYNRDPKGKGKGKKGVPAWQNMRTLAEKKDHLKDLGETVMETDSRRHHQAGTCRMTRPLRGAWLSSTDIYFF